MSKQDFFSSFAHEFEESQRWVSTVFDSFLAENPEVIKDPEQMARFLLRSMAYATAVANVASKRTERLSESLRLIAEAIKSAQSDISHEISRRKD